MTSVICAAAVRPYDERMLLIDALRGEHERIDAAVGALRTWASRHRAGEAPLSDLAAFLFFFETYAGAFHHEREEQVLFPSLTHEAQIPGDRGPLAVLLDDHERMAAMLARMKTTNDREQLHAIAVEYSHALWSHIDVENSVLFEEAERQLRRAGVRELPARDLTAGEDTAASVGDALIARYPPMQPDNVRGEGCVVCHAYGTTCRGLEREWWNEWEWEEMSEHVAAS